MHGDFVPDTTDDDFDNGDYTGRGEDDFTGNRNVPRSKNIPFRSFEIQLYDNRVISVNGIQCQVNWLFDLLKKHNLSPSVPMVLDVNNISFINFDFSPSEYNGPIVFSFTWPYPKEKKVVSESAAIPASTAVSESAAIPASAINAATERKQCKCSVTGKYNYLYIRVHDLTPGVGDKIMANIIKKLKTYYKAPAPRTGVLTLLTTTKRPDGKYQWVGACEKLHRSMETIYIEEKIKTDMVGKLTQFFKLSSMYDKYGVTWKRVHLFHGPPGSGKTSTILALASHFKKNVAKLVISPTLNSQDLEMLFASVPQDTFLVLEDIDALFTKRVAESAIDFPTLLNCLDGLSTKRGMVTFMTTNHIEQLDEALIRPGRVDFKLEFTNPGRDELYAALKTLGAQYEHEHVEFLDHYATGMSIAGVQQHLFECVMAESTTILKRK